MANEVALREEPRALVSASFFDLQGFELMQRIAKGFAASSLVPNEYRDNVANCMIAVSLAQRIGADPLMVMQNLAPINGRPSWSAAFLIATVNTCGRFTPLTYQWSGTAGQNDWGCTAVAMSKSTGEVLEGTEITLGMAKAEGWFERKGSKWKTMPQQMLIYRAAAFWTRAYAPELAVGLATAEEARDIVDLQSDARGAYTASVTPPAPKTITASLDQLATQIDDATKLLDSEEVTTEEVAEEVAAPADAGEIGDAGHAAEDREVKAYLLGRETRERDMPRNYPKGSGFHYKDRAAEAEAFLRGYDEVAAERGQLAAS